MYDTNNNCVVCSAYVFDQHKTTCRYYVKEKLSQFYARIQASICGDCLTPINQCTHGQEK